MIHTLLKKSLSLGIIALICIYFAGTVPLKAHASIGLPFGGYDDGDDYEMCDCSGAVYSWFGPLYLGAVPSTGPLAWYPGTILFSYYLPHPGAAILGTYIPGVQACWAIVGYYCIPIPTLGIIAPTTGVSPE